MTSNSKQWNDIFLFGNVRRVRAVRVAVREKGGAFLSVGNGEVRKVCHFNQSQYV